MSIDTADVRLIAFQSAYGRFCTVAAHALARRVPYGDVRNAMSLTGAGPIPPTLQSLRDMRVRMNDCVAAAKAAGASESDLVESARRARSMVGGEWCCEVPLAAY